MLREAIGRMSDISLYMATILDCCSRSLARSPCGSPPLPGARRRRTENAIQLSTAGGWVPNPLVQRAKRGFGTLQASATHGAARHPGLLSGCE